MRRRPPGWQPPGPVPPGDCGDPTLRPGPEETLDCLAGHWKIFQLRRGHRYSTDDLLTAWYAASAFAAAADRPLRILDLGCGIGSVGLLLLWRFQRASLLGIEAQPSSAELARRSLRFNGVDVRAQIRTGDLRDTDLHAGAGPFDLVSGSPPYLAAGEGQRSHLPQRGPCRFEDRGGVADYLRVAAAHLADGGVVAWVHATRYTPACTAAAHDCGLADVVRRPVLFREGKPSVISLFRARRAPHATVRVESPLTIRCGDGRWAGEYRSVRSEMGFPA